MIVSFWAKAPDEGSACRKNMIILFYISYTAAFVWFPYIVLQLFLLCNHQSTATGTLECFNSFPPLGD